MIETTATRWLLVPCRAVALANGGWANDGATIQNFAAYDAAVEWMATFPAGCGWRVLEKAAHSTAVSHGIAVVRPDGTVEKEDAR